MKKRALVPFITFNVLVILALAGLFVLSEAYPLRPGTSFYRLQHVAEQWRMRLTAGQASRAAMALNLAERRLGDLAQAGVPSRANAAAVAFDRALDEAVRQVEATPRPEQAALGGSLTALLDRADFVLSGLEPAADDVVLQTLQRQVLAMQESNTPEEVVTFVVEPVELHQAEPIPFLGQDIDHTIWPLTGGHGGLECEDCHQQGEYAGTAGDCEDCHGIPESELYPDHFEGECVECHLVDTWDPDEWDHAGIIDCQSCHEEESPEEHYARSNDNWWLLSILSDRQATPKQGSLLDQRHYDRCADCHTSTDEWQEIAFDHFGFTDCQSCHTLEGDLADHFAGQCSICHTIDNWEPLPFEHANVGECRSCHEEDSPGDHYVRADSFLWFVAWEPERADSHSPSLFSVQQTPATCANCHPDTEDWNDVAFDHTSFDDCESCHPRQGDLEVHYMGPCSNCHVIDTWENVTFDHTGYTDCQSCHIPEFDHYPGQCSPCHTTDDWQTVSFSHDGFAACSSCHEWEIPNEHFDGPCSLCHTTNDWTQIIYEHSSTDNCLSCHTTDFDHYGGQCSLCHTTSQWTELIHHTRTNECLRCHVGPVEHYGRKCSLCHDTNEWAGATYNHSRTDDCKACHSMPGQSYGGQCSLCHDTSTWSEATYNHSRTDDCKLCHAVPAQHYGGQCSVCHNTSYLVRGDPAPQWPDQLRFLPQRSPRPLCGCLRQLPQHIELGRG